MWRGSLEISVMKHDGKILTELLHELGIKKGVLAEKIGKNANTITTWLRKDVIPSDDLIEIGRAIRFDLTHKFPRLKKVPEAVELMYMNTDTNMVEERAEEYKTSRVEIGELRIEVKFLREQIEQLKEIIDSKNEIIDSKNEQLKNIIISKNEIIAMKDHEISNLKK